MNGIPSPYSSPVQGVNVSGNETNGTSVVRDDAGEYN